MNYRSFYTEFESSCSGRANTTRRERKSRQSTRITIEMARAIVKLLGKSSHLFSPSLSIFFFLSSRPRKQLIVSVERFFVFFLSYSLSVTNLLCRCISRTRKREKKKSKVTACVNLAHCESHWHAHARVAERRLLSTQIWRCREKQSFLLSWKVTQSTCVCVCEKEKREREVRMSLLDELCLYFGQFFSIKCPGSILVQVNSIWRYNVAEKDVYSVSSG